jgi:hypothetical protein
MTCHHDHRTDGVCDACGDCVHDVILNRACYYCGSTDIDPRAISPKPPEVIAPERLVRR